MNRPTLCAILGGLALALNPLVGQSVTTDPVGFTTLTVKGNSFTLLGLNMVKPVVYQGVVSGVSGATVTDANATFTTSLTAGKKYFVEIISGDYAGLNSEVVSFDGTSLTLADDVGALAASLNGAGHRIREVWTLADVFGATNSAGLGGGTSATADLVYVPNGSGGFSTYYYKTSGVGGTGWRSTSSPSADQSAAAMYFTDAVIVQRRVAGDVSIKLVGAVKTGKTIVAVQPGFNALSSVYPVETLTLANSGLYGASADLRIAGGTSSTADLVYLPDGLGGFGTFYYKTSGVGGTGWRSTGSPSASEESRGITIGSGFFVQRRGASPVSVVLEPNF